MLHLNNNNFQKQVVLFSMLALLLGIPYIFANDSLVDIKVKASSYCPMNVVIGVVGDSKELIEIAKVVGRDISFTQQFNTQMRHYSGGISKKDMRDLVALNVPLGLFLSNPKNSVITVRLYDTYQQKMIGKKKYYKQGKHPRGWAHNISDIAWPLLTGNNGFFSSRIAFCKKVQKKNKRSIQPIVISDYDGSHQQVVINSNTVNIAPRWHLNKNNSLLFYSSYTKENISLRSLKIEDKTKHIACNYDGLSMGPAFSQNGDAVCYCASRGTGSCQIYYYAKNIFKKITQNNGNNISPTMSSDGKNIYFCSDFESRFPQLYVYNVKNEELKKLTTGSYCACPAYNYKKNIVAYVKSVNKILQIFVYDVIAKTHRQITFDGSNKEECSWSPCGNLLLFCQAHKAQSRIAVLNTITNKRYFITPAFEKCTYPNWSPTYTIFPVIT